MRFNFEEFFAKTQIDHVVYLLQTLPVGGAIKIQNYIFRIENFRI